MHGENMKLIQDRVPNSHTGGSSAQEYCLSSTICGY